MEAGPGTRETATHRRHRRIVIALACLTIVAGGALFYFQFPAQNNKLQPRINNPTLQWAGSDAGYVEAATCTGCHREIWETYRHTGMGRSFARPRPEAMVEDFTKANTFFHEASDRHYRMYARDGRYYQRRHQVGFDGREINVVEKEIHFVLGSGNHARTYLNRTPEGRIFELPIAWYSEKGGYWAMNPGYDQPNQYDFSREITQECIFCHDAYPEITPGSDRFGSEPRFPGRIPEGIDCQRCHGPGLRHVQAVQGGKKQAIREAIVNPARLPADLQLEVCMQCHLETTSTRLPHSILRFDRGAFSYRPGQPLSDYVLHFDHAPGTGWDDKFQIAHQAYRLRMSSCFQKSGGRLTCTTCHNPHAAPRGQAAIERYTAACRACHATTLEKQIAARKHTNVPNCLECHMPKRRTDDVVHVVMTDHYIQRSKPARDLLAPLKERHETEETVYAGPVALYYPPQLPPGPDSELYLAVAQVKQLTNLKEGIPRLSAALEKYRPKNGEFYFELAEAYAQVGQHQNAIRLYEEAVGRKPGFWPGWLGLGRTLSKSGQDARAVEALQRALGISPHAPAVLNDLGLIYGRQGKPADAAAVFRKAIETDAAYPEAYNNLGGALTETGDGAGAEQAYRDAIRLQPDFAGAHRNLARLLAARGETAQAEYHFRKAIYHNPNYPAAHFDYGIALAGAERYDPARVQFEAAVRLDPKMAEAHSSLADMLALQGMTARAVQHYEQALAINPEMGSAHLGLGSALASQARRSEAVTHLAKAARSSDPAIRDAAREALEALRR
jgi:predicted CXXCH cytochrome family protein